MTGTVTFNVPEGSFVFHACQGHYRGWQNGVMTVDRDATAAELANNLTQRYFYSFETTGGITWMQIRFLQLIGVASKVKIATVDMESSLARKVA